MGLVTKRVETYDVKICDTLEKCVLPVCVTKIEQRELLTLENPNYPEMLGRYPHLKGVRMEETDTKELLPIHVILEQMSTRRSRWPIISAQEPWASLLPSRPGSGER